MSAVPTISRKPKTRRAVLVAFGMLIVLAFLFCGWVYKAKAQRDLNMQLLGAVRKNDTEAVLALLARGADPNIRDVPQQHLSLWQQIRLAFNHDNPAPDDQTDAPKRTVLELALTWDNEAYADDDTPRDTENVVVVNALLDAGARTEDSSHAHQTPLMTAVSRDRLKTVQALLDHGANPLAGNDEGKLPIHCMNDDFGNKVKIAELLVACGTDVNATDKEGRTSLLNDSFYWDGSDVPILSYLVAHGAAINAKTKEGESALLIAVRKSDFKTVRFLIEHGAEVNICDNDKNTPLIIAAGFGSARNVEFLISHGANLNQRNHDGETALSLAIGAESTDCTRLLKAAGAKP